MADPFSFDLPDPFRVSQRRRAAYPPLSDVETDSAINALTGAGLSGLGYVGSTLDKFFGGRAVRAGANAVFNGGSARDVLSAIPGSDLVGLTNPDDAVSGEDLVSPLYRAATGHDPSQGNWLERNLVGPAAEIALDPSTYLGGIGAMTKAGKAAAKTGSVTKGFLPAVRAGERNLMYGLRGPAVADAAGAVAGGLGSVGRVGVNLAGKLPGGQAAISGVQAAAEAVPPAFRSLFDTKAGPVANRVVQAANEFTRVPERAKAIQSARGNAFDLYQQIQPALAAGADPEQVYRYLTQVGELGQATPHPSLQPHLGDLDAAASRLRDLYDPMPGAERGLGLRGGELASNVDLDYMLRRAIKAPAKAGSRAEKTFRVTNPSQIQRKTIFDQPGGTVQLEDWIRDPAMSGSGRTMDPKDVTRTILDANMDWAGNYQGNSLPLDFPKRAARRSKGLANYLGTVKDDYIDLPGRATPTMPFFNRDVPGNYLARATRGADVTSAAKAVYDVIKRVGDQGAGTPVPKVLGKAGLRGIGAYENAARALGLDPTDIVDQATAAAGGQVVDAGKALRDVLKGYSLPATEATAATKYMNRFTTPEELGPFTRALDSVLNLTKAGLYSIWPASHMRNLASGLFENALEGTASPGAYKNAADLLTGVNPGPDRTAALREMFVHGVIGQPQGEFSQAVGTRVPEVGTGNPALPRKGVLASARPWLDVVGAIKDPRGVAGVGGRQVSTNPMVRAGRDVSTAIEDRLRVAQYLDSKAKGFAPEAAAGLVKKTHIDYSDLTDFERNKAKRLLPFYTFSSRNIPKQVGRAVTDPLKVAGPIRLGGGADDEGYVPQYLRSGMALPLGDAGDGTQRYLSQFGLPFEEAFGRLKVGSSPADTTWRTLEGLLGMLRPELRYSLENATGKQFYSGRDLADLRPGTIEKSITMDDDMAGFLTQIASATPASRFVSTANRMLDDRKDLPTKLLSLLTGAKLTDVDVNKWRAIDARHNLEKQMQGQANIRESTDYYPTPEAKAAGTITPEQEYELRLYAGMKARAKEAAKEKRVGIMMGTNR